MEKVKIPNRKESEDNETKDLLLKKIESMFENWYFFMDIKKHFPTLYSAKTEKINLLYTQVLYERFKKDPTLIIQKDIDIYKSSEDQIDTTEKRRTLRKAIKRSERNKEDEEDSNIIQVTNGIRVKRILNLFSTTKFKKENRKDQSKESKKEMSLLKSLKMMTMNIQKN
jgi:hypothetical protein